MLPPKSQIPYLDGLRAIAILLVVNGHLNAEFVKEHGSNWYARVPFVTNGWIGVDLFFVLSGFFIGSQLWKELRDRCSISFPRFVVRRGLRIWPLYFFTFLCVLLVSGHAAAAKQYGWSDIVFITNYHNRGLVLGSWSLCTEEQFYIITPLTLLLLSSRVSSLRRFRAGLWVLLAIVSIVRALTWIHLTGSFFDHSPVAFEHVYYKFHTHCDGLIVGLILSNLWISRDRPSAPRWRSLWIVALAFASLLALRAIQKEIFSFTGLALLFGSLAWYGLNAKTYIFNSRVFYWISRLSFGMYLNHEYLREWVVTSVLPLLHLGTGVPAELVGVLLLTLVSAAIALVTFCLVEFPFLELRKRLLAKDSRHRTPPLTVAQGAP